MDGRTDGQIDGYAVAYTALAELALPYAVEKLQRRYIIPTWGQAPTEPICTKICTVGLVAIHDILNRNFQALQF